MRLIRILMASLLSAALLLFCGACGSTTTSGITALLVNPTNFSMNRGEIQQITVTATNSGGSTVTGKYFYSSSDTSLFTVTTGGLLCAGTWDPSGLVCTPTTNAGSARLTITAADSNAAVYTTVYVHERADSVLADIPTPTLSDCLSVGSTTIQSSSCTTSTGCDYKQLVAHAYSNDSTVCSNLHSKYPEIAATAPCPLPDGTQKDSSGTLTPNTVGEFTWIATDTTIVSIDNTTRPSGRATPVAPGATTVWAELGNGATPTKSPAASFITCPIVAMTFVRADTEDDTSFSLDTSATKNFTITATDSKGTTLTSPPVEWFVSNSTSYDFAQYSTINALTGQATAVKAGSTTVLGTDCVSDSCNRDLDPVFSNFVVAKVNGTANTPELFVASTKSMSVQPITGTSLGTTISLPRLPNSFLLSPVGTYGLMGSSSGGIMSLGTASNSTTSNNTLNNAKVISMAPTGGFAAAITSSDYYLISLTNATITHDYKIAGVTAAAFSPVGYKVYILNGTNIVYIEDFGKGTLSTVSLSAPIYDASFVVNGPFAYLAELGGLSVNSYCGSAEQMDWHTATAPSMIKAFPTQSGAVAIDGSTMWVITSTNITQSCPPGITDAVTSYDLGLGSDTIASMYITPDNSKVILVTTAGKLLVASISNGSVTGVQTVSISNNATVYPTAGLQGNGKNFYVGGSDGLVHRIDLTATPIDDAQTIDPKLKQTDGSTVAVPDLVQIRNM